MKRKAVHLPKELVMRGDVFEMLAWVTRIDPFEIKVIAIEAKLQQLQREAENAREAQRLPADALNALAGVDYEALREENARLRAKLAAVRVAIDTTDQS